MSVTYKLIAEVKRNQQKQWHDEQWHKFMSRKEVKAIVFALDETAKDPDRTTKDIRSEALKYLEVVKKRNERGKNEN